MSIAVRALPVHEVIEDIAAQWKVPIQKKSLEFRIDVPEDLGSGFIRCSNFKLGLGVLEYNCTFNTDYQFIFTINKTHPLKFIFCSKGLTNHTFEEDNDIHTIKIYQNVIVASSGNYGHILGFKADVETHITSIEINRKEFEKGENHDFTGLDPTLKKVFKDIDAKYKFFYQGNYSMRTADLVGDINSIDLEGFLRSIFLEAKLYEMLVIQIEQYQDDLRADKIPQILRKTDIINVKKVTEIIKENLDHNFMVESLAKKVGTNVNKLQDGFKYMYDLTVNKYMQHVKLEEAKRLLETSDFNISQIVHLIGLNNRSYFSKIFKEKYGVSPKYFLKNKTQKKEQEN